MTPHELITSGWGFLGLVIWVKKFRGIYWTKHKTAGNVHGIKMHRKSEDPAGRLEPRDVKAFTCFLVSISAWEQMRNYLF